MRVQEYHQGVMTTVVDDCQFVCITQSDYYKILHEGEDALVKETDEESGLLVKVDIYEIYDISIPVSTGSVSGLGSFGALSYESDLYTTVYLKYNFWTHLLGIFLYIMTFFEACMLALIEKVVKIRKY